MVHPRAADVGTSSVDGPNALVSAATGEAGRVFDFARENWHVSPAGTSPVVAIRPPRAIGAHGAYASGAPLRCTA